MKIKKKQRKTKAADIYVKENVSTGKEKATYLYMEQNSKDTNKIFLGENMKNCNIFFFTEKKFLPWLGSILTTASTPESGKQ